MKIELQHDVRAVSLRSLNTYVEECGDLFIAFALGQELNDFPLSRRQRAPQPFCATIVIEGSFRGGPGNPGRKKRFALPYGVYCGQQVPASVILQDVPTRSRFQHAL